VSDGGLPPALKAGLHGLEGRRVLHLGCGGGEGTVELAALGALVTGVDADEGLLDAAHRRAPELPWLHGDAEHLPAELQRGRTDLVLASPRSLLGASDLDAWAAGLALPLRPGGELIVHADHPVLTLLDEVLRWRGDYFAEGAAPRVDQIVNAVAGAGLLVSRLEEHPEHPPLRPQASRAPGQLLVVAARPG
jgi:ubiquinone/menaquinone biosynthesis C-methylase UbiE